MRLIGNIIWFLFGGFMIAIEYFVASVVLLITLVGIPFGLQTIKLGTLSLWPFGARIVNHGNNPGCLNLVMNIIWIIIGGFWISLTHLFWGLVLCITIIGIPFGKQHFKLIRLALFPFGKEIVYR